MASLSRFRCILSPCSNAGPVGSWFSSTSNSYELLVWSSKAVAKSWHCLLSSWNRDISPIFSTTFSKRGFHKQKFERKKSLANRPLFPSTFSQFLLLPIPTNFPSTMLPRPWTATRSSRKLLSNGERRFQEILFEYSDTGGKSYHRARCVSCRVSKDVSASWEKRWRNKRKRIRGMRIRGMKGLGWKELVCQSSCRGTIGSRPWEKNAE